MNIRSLVFWISDFLRGGEIRSHYEQLEDFQRNGLTENYEQLRTILNYAVSNVEFYKRYAGYKSLTDFPIINKSVIKANEKSFFSPDFDKSKLFKESTSGSTGTPMIIYQDAGKRRRATADTIYFSDFAGYHIGSRLYYSRVWNRLNRKSRAASLIQNIVMWDSDRLDDADLQRFIDTLEKDSSEKSVLIFASTLAALYRYMMQNNVRTTARVKCFITMSESLPENVRTGIAELFNTVVVARYSDCECGIIAQQCPHENEYHINFASFHIEVLKLDSDESADYGEAGRIVVTDLYNRSMPLIRYDTGDIGVLSPKSKCGISGPVFSRIDGRRIDCLYSTSGKMLSPYIVNNTMWRYGELKQYQLIQEDANRYVMKLNLDSLPFLREDDMLNDIKEYLGADANIEIKYVDEIPLLSSGKRKQVICNYKK